MHNVSFIGADARSSIDGRYAHSAVVANDNLLIVTAGFRGNVLDDILALTLPSVMTSDVSSHQSTW